MPRKERTTKLYKEHATRLHSRIVRGRVMSCEAFDAGVITTPCASHGPSRFQCAHIIHRQYSATRTHLDNAWCLCAGHHLMVDTNADYWMKLVQATCGEDHVDSLRQLANAGPPFHPVRLFWISEFDRLRAIAVDEGADLKGIPKS